jgi:RHS repeat-associated protein
LNPGAPNAITILYDGLGDRVSKTANGVTTRFLVDNNNPTGYAQLVEELTCSAPSSVTVSRTYTYGQMLISESQVTGGGSGSNWATSFYGLDGHGSVRFLIDSSGNVTDTYDFDAFGILVHQTGSTPNLYLYSGEQFDPDLGIYYQRARYLNTSTGRFFAMDSFEGDRDEPLTLHKYAYAGLDPVDNVDPSGRDFDIPSLLAAAQDQLILVAINHPILASVVTSVLTVIVPAEVQFALPEFGVASEVSLSTLLANAGELTQVRQLFEQLGGFPKLGTDFETWIGKILNLQSAKTVVKDGVAVDGRAKVLGSAVIDFFNQARTSILEVKLTGKALKANQTEELAKYAEKEGIGLTFIFLQKPTDAELQALVKTVRDVAPNVDVAINYLYTALRP